MMYHHARKCCEYFSFWAEKFAIYILFCLGAYNGTQAMDYFKRVLPLELEFKIIIAL